VRDEALIHFFYGRQISAGVHLHTNGGAAPVLISEAAPYLHPKEPGRCVVGFCNAHPSAVDDIVSVPPSDWQNWGFKEWDAWFGRINGVFLVDLAKLIVTQHPLYSCAPHVVRCDLTELPGRLMPVEEWLPP